MPACFFFRSSLAGLVLAGALAIAPRSAEASGIDLSASAGSARARVAVSSTSCVGDASWSRTLDARLLVGPNAGQKLAAAGSNQGFGSAVLIVPDWADPSQPAVVEATCTSVDLHSGAGTTQSLAAVPFDVLASGARSTLDVDLGRTTFRVGQATSVTGNGCTEPLTTHAVTGVQEGSDLSGRNAADPLWGPWGGFHAVDAQGYVSGRITAETSLVAVEVLGAQDPAHAQIAVSEQVRAVRPGSHVAFTACAQGDGTQLFAKPRAVTLLPNADVDRSDLVTVPTPPTLPHRVRMSGHGCTQGAVRIALTAESLASIRSNLRSGATAPAPATSGDGPRVDVRRRGSAGTGAAGSSRSGAAPAAIGPQSTLASVTVAPDGNGDWSYEVEVPFTEGFVGGQAVCANPLGSGFRYHAQGVRLGGPALPGGGSSNQ